MSEKERQILKANMKLVDEKAELLKDIKALILYIKGFACDKEAIEEIINYYENKQLSRDYKRR